MAGAALFSCRVKALEGRQVLEARKGPREEMDSPALKARLVPWGLTACRGLLARWGAPVSLG